MLTGDGCFCIVGDINKQQEELIMSLAFIIYLAGIVKDVCALLFITAVVLLIIYFWLNDWLESSRDTNTKPPKSLAITGFLVLLIVALTPNKETLYTMVAAHTVQDIATSPEVQKLAGKSLEVINKAMDEYLKGDKPETGEK